MGLFLERFSRQLGGSGSSTFFGRTLPEKITQDPRFTSDLLLSNMTCRHGDQLLKRKLQSARVISY